MNEHLFGCFCARVRICVVCARRQASTTPCMARQRAEKNRRWLRRAEVEWWWAASRAPTRPRPQPWSCCSSRAISTTGNHPLWGPAHCTQTHLPHLCLLHDGDKKHFPDALCHIVTFRESQRKCSCTCVQTCVCVFPPSLARRAHPRARGRPSEGRGAMCHLPDTSTHTITPTWVWATIWCQDSTTSIKVHSNSMSSCYFFLLGEWFYDLFWSEVSIATKNLFLYMYIHIYIVIHIAKCNLS